MPVEPWGLQQNVAQSGALRGDKDEIKRSLVLPQDVNADASTLRIDLAPSIAGTLMSALDFLATYPYGCVEQTMSSFLPNILVTKAIKDLGLTPPAASTELDKKIAAGLERLYMFQHDDGGWGWWQTDETHPFMTAYVVAGLAQAKDAGYPIDEQRLKNGRDSLLKQIKENPRALADIRVYMIYALALSGDVDRALVDDLYSSREKFSAAWTGADGPAADATQRRARAGIRKTAGSERALGRSLCFVEVRAPGNARLLFRQFL